MLKFILILGILETVFVQFQDLLVNRHSLAPVAFFTRLIGILFELTKLRQVINPADNARLVICSDEITDLFQ